MLEQKDNEHKEKIDELQKIIIVLSNEKEQLKTEREEEKTRMVEEYDKKISSLEEKCHERVFTLAGENERLKDYIKKTDDCRKDTIKQLEETCKYLTGVIKIIKAGAQNENGREGAEQKKDETTPAPNETGQS